MEEEIESSENINIAILLSGIYNKDSWLGGILTGRSLFQEPELFTFLSIQTILRFYMLRLNHKIEFRYNLLQCVS